jgi:hypothetical protein
MTTATNDPRPSIGLSAALLLAGQVLYVAVTQGHAGGDANDHHHIFEAYAENGIWTAVHIGQFAAVAAMLVGLLVLALTIEAGAGTARWLARCAAGGALVTLALYGVLQAVDGVALKHAVSAWANAPESEKAARFASAESMRWLEWGLRSYQDYAMGLTLILLAGAAGRSRFLAWPFSALVGLSGLAYLAQGWVAGTDGFTAAQSIAIVLAWVLSLVWMSWLLVAAPRMKDVSAASDAEAAAGATSA